MTKVELVKTFIQLVEYANERNADGVHICINAPDGGKLNCRFEFDAILPEGHNDN